MSIMSGQQRIFYYCTRKDFNYSQIAERLDALRFFTRTGKAFRTK